MDESDEVSISEMAAFIADAMDYQSNIQVDDFNILNLKFVF